MNRREFITLAIGAAASWPHSARAQQGDRVRRIGVLMAYEENDPEGKRLYSAFTQALAGLGWTDGRNLRMELRWGGNDTNRIPALAQELVGLQPDIIVTAGTPAIVAGPAGDADDPDRLCERRRPRRQRPRPAARPPEWKHHRLRQLRSLAGRQVA